jgi:hypothetical protein
MKFINKPKKVKKGYLYAIKDNDSIRIVIARKNVYKKKYIYFDEVTNKETFISFLNYKTISKIPETDKNFDEKNRYALYELGPKEDYPEYFI